MSDNREAEKLKREHARGVAEGGEYLTNPVNSFLLIKRVVVGWKSIQDTISFDDLVREAVSDLDEIRRDRKCPGAEDLSGAAEGLLRLQDVYQLSAASLANGRLHASSRLSVNDCYELGIYGFAKGDYDRCQEWMMEALSLLSGDLERNGIHRWEVLEFLAYTHYKQGKLGRAVELTDELLEINPTHQAAISNRANYLAMMDSTQHKPEEKHSPEPSEEELYKMACRQEISPTTQLLAGLTCHYTSHNPFLKLAPLKKEEVFTDPDIVIFRDVLSDGEIKQIIGLVEEKRASTENVLSGAPDTSSEIRLSKFGWLSGADSELLQGILRRAEHITSLSTTSAEQMQVVNYGIGGHYILHEDYAKLSDVTEGGSTVFPRLHLSVRPQKGTALLWMNLLPDGQGDPRSRHAACPVLIGSKWVATIWFHELGQEFRRPCGLFPNSPVS